MNSLIKTIIILVFTFCLIAPFAYFAKVYYDCYDIIISEKKFSPSLATKIYDSNGELITEFFDENRTYADFCEIPEIVKRAFLLAEDSSFYLHTGFDIKGIIRAFITDVAAGKIEQGGSTITQQLVKQLYAGNTKSIKRKLLEIIISGEIEKKYSKNEILEMYLNQIYFGHGIYGIKSAARFYFKKKLSEINIYESVILASIPSAPNRFSPLKNPRNCFERSGKIFAAHIENGALRAMDSINQFNAFWQKYLAEIKCLSPQMNARHDYRKNAKYFSEYIRMQLIEMYGEETVYCGGLRVYTTLDMWGQSKAEQILSDALKRQSAISGRFNKYKKRKIDYILAAAKKGNGESHSVLRQRASFMRKFRNEFLEEASIVSLIMGSEQIFNPLSLYQNAYEGIGKNSRVEGALVALDPSDGSILAMVGGSGFSGDNQLNRAVNARRQPGSAFKAFVYGAGLECRKITPASGFLDLPVIFVERNREEWRPSNYGEDFQGRVLARNALAASLNIVSVLIYDKIGGRRISDFGSRLTGVPENRFEIDPTLALGSSEMTPLEMASGFAAIANRGVRAKPFSIISVVDAEGKELYNHRSQKGTEKKVITEETAFLLTDMLRDVVDRGTASRALRIDANFRLPAAGKTGTTSEFRDAWFVGFTPDLAASVWIGCDSQTFDLGPGQSGSVAAAPVWGRFMKEIYSVRKRKYFAAKPKGVVRKCICRISGLKPGPGCPVKKEYFIRGTEPHVICDGKHHKMQSIEELAKSQEE